MNKRIISLLMALLIAISVFSLPVFAENTPVIKNIIYLIPDGGGYALYDFANMVKIAGGFDKTLFPTKTPTTTDPMTMKSYLAGSMITLNLSGKITDSAAAGTAMATGHKTINSYIGVNKDLIPVANLVEAAESVGKATGIISTYHWAHATPAAFTAHAEGRNDALNLYEQIENKDLEVVLGVGYGNVSQYATIQNAIDAGYTIVKTKEDLLKVKPGDKIWGNVDPNGIPYDVFTEEGEPTLAEMTSGALEALKGDEDGFFLMVEGGKVDTGGHSNSANTTTSEYLAFDAAFKVAIDFAKGRTDTVVICAPDHDTGGMIIPEDPEVAAAAVATVMAGGNPSNITWESYSHTARNVGVWVYAPEGVSLIDGLNTTLGDTPETRENYVIDNTDIAPWCASLMGVDLEALSEELFCDVTTIGQYNILERKFTFNNGDGSKYIYTNQDEYYKDGETISLNGKTSMYINNHFYVPAEVIEEEDWDYVTPEPPRDGITGTGTATDPYILDDAYDFMIFTSNMISGNTYSGKYIRQIKDIDLRTFTEYKGIGKSFNFAGTYDGYGKKLLVSINAESDVSVFPVVTGTLMNVGVEGSITSSGDGAFAAAVAYYVSSGGKIVNCYSNAKVKSALTGGITTYNEGLVGNCSFCGTLTSSKGRAVPIGMTKSGKSYEFWECYYIPVRDNYATNIATEVTESAAKSTLAETLNANRITAAEKLGLSSSYVAYWNNDYGYPTHGTPKPVVEGVIITPNEAVVNKGEGIQLSAEVTGKNNPSQKVIWSVEGDVSEDTTITSDGYLYVSPEEKATSFMVMAKSHQDGGIADAIIITVGESSNVNTEGTSSNPYLIETAADFKEFTDALLAGNNFIGKHFRQTANIDMAGVSGYVGVGSNCEFAGTYDGNGYTINVAIESSSDGCLFPYTTGTIMNLGVTGSLNNTSYAASICRSVRESGKLLNCWSNATIVAPKTGAIARSNYGLLANCYFAGTVNSSSSYSIASQQSGCRMANNYYLGTTYVEDEAETQITSTQYEENLTAWLNSGIAEVSELSGISSEKFQTWVLEDGVVRFPGTFEEVTVSIASSTGGKVYSGSTLVNSVTFNHGEEITLSAVPEEGASFKAWINVATGKVISTEAEYTFTSYTDKNIYALFADESDESNVFVSFINKTGQYIRYRYLEKGSDASKVAPASEVMYASGYNWNSFTPQPGVVNESTDYVGSYTKASDVYDITISGGTANGSTSLSLEYNESFTAVANAPAEGKVFTGWLVNDKLVSLNPELTFRVFGDMTIEATYGTSLADVPFAAFADITKWAIGKYNFVSFTGTSYVPEGYTFTEAGILYVKAEADASDLVLENEGKMVSDKEIKRTSVTKNQMFKLTASYPESGISARAYLVYLDSHGKKYTVYTDVNNISSTEE